jgi:hypothetical protein
MPRSMQFRAATLERSHTKSTALIERSLLIPALRMRRQTDSTDCYYTLAIRIPNVPEVGSVSGCTSDKGSVTTGPVLGGSCVQI